MAASTHRVPLPEHALMQPSLLALAIVQSADSAVPIRDYAASLRAHLRNRSSSNSQSSRPGCTSGCLDAASYWKQRFIESEAAQVALRDKVHDLETQTRSLAHRVGKYEDGSNAPPPSTTPTSVGGKLLPEIGAACAAVEMNEVEHSMFEALPRGHYVIRELHALRRLLRQRANINATDLSSTLIRLSQALSDTLRAACSQLVSSETANASDKNHRSSDSSFHAAHQSETAFFSAARIRAYLGKGFDRLSRVPDSCQNHGRVIHCLTRSYDDILSLLRQLGSENNRIETDRLSLISSGLVRHLSSSILSLNLKTPGHKELMEGYVACLLHHTGILLKQEVLDPDQSLGHGTSTVIPPQASSNHILPFITWLLKSVSHILKGSSGNMPLVSRERELFQRTMLRAVFGEADGDFIDTLKFDRDKARELILLDNHTAEDKIAAFLQTVWSCIGWDAVGLTDTWEMG